MKGQAVTSEKRKAYLRSRRKRQTASAILFAFEMLVGIIAGTITAFILLPIAKSIRGYIAFGSEWLVIIAVSYAAFWLFNNWIFKKIQEE